MDSTFHALTAVYTRLALAAALTLLAAVAALRGASASSERTPTAPVQDAQRNGSRSVPGDAQPLIKEIVWAPKETVIRRAKGGDNWPLTWGDDDALYSAYGDGNGFEPFIAQKLSLGVVKITGSPPDFRGVNLRSPTAEATGNDVRGHKASGMLMVDGVLYMLVRNVGNARIGWSLDRAATWAWADWKLTESFGAPTFINFGRNYEGARDDFVYIVSHDSGSAYIPSDGFVLARVPRARVRELAAWEYYAGRENGRPAWTRDVSGCAQILTAPGESHRCSVSYNAALGRYLLVNPVPTAASRDASGKVDTRFVGGLAIYESSEPWGPWTRVYYSQQWDVGPGETASFPPKWMSSDGGKLHLVFSGDDYFAVRQATLVLDARR